MNVLLWPHPVFSSPLCLSLRSFKQYTIHNKDATLESPCQGCITRCNCDAEMEVVGRGRDQEIFPNHCMWMCEAEDNWHRQWPSESFQRLFKVVEGRNIQWMDDDVFEQQCLWGSARLSVNLPTFVLLFKQASSSPAPLIYMKYQNEQIDWKHNWVFHLGHQSYCQMLWVVIYYTCLPAN